MKINLKSVKAFFTKKRIIYIVVALGVLFLGYLIFFNKKAEPKTLTVHAGEFLQQVSVSGKVIATENLDLSFEQTGIVSGVYVKIGDIVNAGKFLAGQNTGELSSQLKEMQAGIDLQKARLNQLLAGSSPEDIKIKADAVALAKQDLKSSYDSALVALNTAYSAIYDSSTLAIYMKNTYFTSNGSQDIKVQQSRNAISASLADAKKHLDNATMSQDAIDTAITNVTLDLATTYSHLKIIREQCDEDVYYSRVSATDKTSLDTQRASVNTASTSLSSAKQSISSYKALLQQAQNQLEVIQAPSRQTDIAVFEAQIRQAEASAQNVVAQIRKKQIFSPINGIVTNVLAKVGSILSPGQLAVSLISSGKFQIEGYVPEIYISLVKVGNEADVTLDSYGSDKIFKARVISIEPSETIRDGVSTYKVLLEFTDAEQGIKSGMSANVLIITNKKSNVISVPQGLVKNSNGKKFVKVKQGEEVIEKEVQTGEISSSGQVEILSGLNEGDVLTVD